MSGDYIKLSIESYFTGETHIRHVNEIKEGMTITDKTQVLEGEGKKLSLFHVLERDDGEIVATGEHMLIHVCLKPRASCMPSAKLDKELQKYVLQHENLPLPDGAGNSIGR